MELLQNKAFFRLAHWQSLSSFSIRGSCGPTNILRELPTPGSRPSPLTSPTGTNNYHSHPIHASTIPHSPTAWQMGRQDGSSHPGRGSFHPLPWKERKELDTATEFQFTCQWLALTTAQANTLPKESTGNWKVNLAMPVPRHVCFLFLVGNGDLQQSQTIWEE